MIDAIYKEKFICITKDSLTDFYHIKKLLGEGGFGKVYKVQNKKTQEYFACKKVSKINLINLEKFKTEINILSSIDHPNIVKLYQIYESNRSLYLIMELCEGGELLKKITEKAMNNNIYTEKEAAEIIREIISGIEYCHNQGICHRDLKPENILYLYDNAEKNNPLKVIDFGLSKHFKVHKLTSRVGSVHYISPEVLQNAYTEKCDIWSGGVMLYLLLSGHVPFNGRSTEEIFSKINKCEYNFNNKVWNNISDEAKDLISHMICFEKERYNGKEVLAHPWFKIISNKNFKNLSIDFTVFKNYAQENQFKKIILYFIATRLNEKEIKELKEIFKKFDTDFDGQISLEEFEKCFIQYQNKNHLINISDIKNIFNSVDINKNGKIDYSEFIAASLTGREEIVEKRLLEAFFSYDVKLTGKISKENFLKALHIDSSMIEKCEDKIKELCNSDFIDYNQFLKNIKY